MSKEQITREFPFIEDKFGAHEETWSDATLEPRVSRLSVEALELPLEKIGSREEGFIIVRSFEVLDKEGKSALPQPQTDSLHSDVLYEKTLGDKLIHLLRGEEDEVWDGIQFITYTEE